MRLVRVKMGTLPARLYQLLKPHHRLPRLGDLISVREIAFSRRTGQPIPSLYSKPEGGIVDRVNGEGEAALYFAERM